MSDTPDFAESNEVMDALLAEVAKQPDHVIEKLIEDVEKKLSEVTGANMSPVLNSLKKDEVEEQPTHDKSETVMNTAISHGYGVDSKRTIAKVLGVPLNVIMLAQILFDRVTEHELWDCRRAPHALFVDCIYIVCRHKKVKITSRQIAQKTKEHFGVGTQPRPGEWSKDYSFIVDTVLS